MSISHHIIEFEWLFSKIKNFNMALPNGVLAYKFFNNANICRAAQTTSVCNSNWTKIWEYERSN